jgi:hypothetical protein
MIGRKVTGNMVVTGVIMIVGGAAALYVGYLIAGNLDAQFNQLATQQNLSSDYVNGITNTRNIVIGVFGLIGVSLFVVGAGLVIRSLGIMGS